MKDGINKKYCFQSERDIAAATHSKASKKTTYSAQLRQNCSLSCDLQYDLAK
jgi:hypothetical protein